MTRNQIDLSGDLKLVAGEIRNHPRAVGKYYLTSKALIDFLERIKAGEVDSDLVVVISDLLEANDSIEVERGKEDVVADVLFFLSNPEINGHPDSLEISKLISLLAK